MTSADFFAATKWPEGFDPDDRTVFLQCTIVDERSPAGANIGLHAHTTGQFVAALNGLVGLELGERRLALPPASAAWVPPGIRHEGLLGQGAASLYCHVFPDWAKLFPAEPCQLLLTPLTLELMKHFAEGPACTRLESHEGRLARVLCEELMLAPRLPLFFAPMPAHEGLRAAAEAIAARPSIARTAASWAESLSMSERTLSRLTLRETGLSFGVWRQRLVMLAAADLLLKGTSSEKAAFDLGYASPSAFTAAFRRTFGTTPGNFRRQHRC